MGLKEIAASVLVVLMTTPIHIARASETRSAMRISAQVVVAGSIDVKTVSTADSANTQQTRHVAGETVVAAPATGEQSSNCTSVTLICSGPASMRIAVRTDSAANSSGETASNDACASPSRTQGGGLLLCSAAGATAPNILGVSIDY